MRVRECAFVFSRSQTLQCEKMSDRTSTVGNKSCPAADANYDERRQRQHADDEWYDGPIVPGIIATTSTIDRTPADAPPAPALSLTTTDAYTVAAELAAEVEMADAAAASSEYGDELPASLVAEVQIAASDSDSDDSEKTPAHTLMEPLSLPMVTIVHSQRGAEQLCVDGYIYHQNKRAGGKTYWECEERRKRSWNFCQAKAITAKPPDGALELLAYAPHTHAPNPAARHIKTAVAAFKSIARTTKRTPGQIMRAQRLQAGDLAAVLAPLMPSQNATRKIISRERRRLRDKNVDPLAPETK